MPTDPTRARGLADGLLRRCRRPSMSKFFFHWSSLESFIFTVDVNSFVLSLFCNEFIFRWSDPNNKLSMRDISKKQFKGRFWNTMRRRLIGQVDTMERASGGKGKKRLVKGKGKGSRRLAGK